MCFNSAPSSGELVSHSVHGSCDPHESDDISIGTGVFAGLAGVTNTQTRNTHAEDTYVHLNIRTRTVRVRYSHQIIRVVARNGPHLAQLAVSAMRAIKK